ncbi:hypothetical protein ACFLYN_02090 [Chloroflexota bacterium]
MTYPEYCEGCVYRDKKNPDICKSCSRNETIQARFEFGKVDIFKLAEGLKKKHQEQSNKKPEPEKNNKEPPIKLGICPHCGHPSLFYNHRSKKSECLNRECKSNNIDIFKNVIWPSDSPKSNGVRNEFITRHREDLSNPLLLSVKMFLADVRSWRRQYIESEYVCSDFAREVYDAATERGIRCGYVVISFQISEVGHAVIAFETDYGLIFIEPQDGETIDLSIGKTYSTMVDGVPENDGIRLIKISWNDGTSTIMD